MMIQPLEIDPDTQAQVEEPTYAMNEVIAWINKKEEEADNE